MGHATDSVITRTTALLLCALVFLAACNSDEDRRATVRIGLMLPYTGDLSSTSANHERAVLFAKAQIERVGLSGKRLELVFADSHSDVKQGLAAVEGLLAKDVAAVIGFESDELARELLPRLEQEGVVLITPGISAAIAGGAERPWFRVAPSTAAMAENLAKELFARGVRRCAVLHTKDQYNLSFAAAFSERMRRSGGEVEVEVEVDSGLRTYPEALNMLREETSIVLAAPAEVAARVVNEFYAAQRSPTWLLTPALRSEAFVLNASPEALEGALGIAPELKVDSRFAAAFSEHFQGDVPLDSALYYYDAAALFVLAYERASALNDAQRPSYEQLVESLFAAAFPVGVETTWDALSPAIADLREGTPRYYRGLTGRIAFAADGERGVGAPKLWTVTDVGEIVDLE
jgi:ABC-type branched-subunit amino acid transport system substrate-binding protein